MSDSDCRKARTKISWCPNCDWRREKSGKSNRNYQRRRRKMCVAPILHLGLCAGFGEGGRPPVGRMKFLNSFRKFQSKPMSVDSQSFSKLFRDQAIFFIPLGFSTVTYLFTNVLTVSDPQYTFSKGSPPAGGSHEPAPIVARLFSMHIATTAATTAGPPSIES